MRLHLPNRVGQISDAAPFVPQRYAKKLAIGAVNTPAEHAAERGADAALKGAPSALLPRNASAERLAGEAPPVVHQALRAPGHPLDPDTRAFFESRFRHDFSRVRVHSDVEAARSADAIGAEAYTSGQHIVFASGAFAARSAEGRSLLSHELAHTIQQSGGPTHVQRRPKKAVPDPLCDKFGLEIAIDAADEALARLKEAKEEDNVAKRQQLVRVLKPIVRCADADDVKKAREWIGRELGTTRGKSIWEEAKSPLGGYTGMYPGYAGDMSGRLRNLGVTERVKYQDYAVPDYDHDKPAKPGDVQKGADEAALDLPDVDIIYFRGHQYAQYLAPGVFTSGNSSRAIDLRYLQSKGSFSHVKLMVSTSCATLCAEPFKLFHGLFPNAVLLGFRRSTPIDGSGVRDSFQAKLTKQDRPLLLDYQPDIASLIDVWRSIAESRLAGADSLPAYWDGSKLHYYDGAKWGEVDPTSAANACKHKGDETTVFPAPP